MWGGNLDIRGEVVMSWFTQLYNSEKYSSPVRVSVADMFIKCSRCSPLFGGGINVHIALGRLLVVGLLNLSLSFTFSDFIFLPEFCIGFHVNTCY